ncbi:ABC-three component system protein [Acinetobacter pittii]|uniref:ABC-three component system protein n=1 Tax=Acinetobacter pittii TaxID=48296 RepID=UPI002E16EE48|nr:ABC-three component system protein [Acinetobacter pittii]
MEDVTKDASTKLAGYIFQIQRALHRILKSDASNLVIGIETDDDVVEISSDKNSLSKITLEQDKHSINPAKNPYQDSSKNLWHTFHIWLDSMEKMQQNYSKINYCLVTNSLVNEKSLAYALSEAIQEDDIEKCILLMRKIGNESEDGVGNSETIKTVLAYSEEKIKFLIRNLELKDCNATEDEENLKEATINLFHLHEDFTDKKEFIYDSLLGYLTKFCQERWKLKEAAWINKNQISNRLYHEISNIKFQKYIEQPLISTQYRQYLSTSNGSHLFIEQLTYLGLPDNYCNNALEAYWGFYSEKVRLEDEGEVLPSQWETRNSALHDRWTHINNNVQTFSTSTDDIHISKQTIQQTLDPNFLAPIGENKTMHPYFTIGNYHYLANLPEYQYYIYWHSMYAKKDA